MKNFSLTWYLGNYPNTKAGAIREISTDILIEYLNKSKEIPGTLRLSLEDNDNISRITVDFENKKYMITYGYEQDAEWHPCGFIAHENNGSAEEFRGDYWNSCLIFDDFELAKKIFLEFFQSGGQMPSWAENKDQQ